MLFAIVQGDLATHTANAVCRIFLGEGCEDTAASVQTALEKALSGDYVALGHSLASGEGAGDYHHGTNYDNRDDWDPRNWGDDSHNRCRRSTSSNAEQTYASPDLDFFGGFTAVYCSGATQTDLDNPNGSNAIAIPAAREPGPLVIRCRSRTVAKVDSIGFVARRWTQCSAG